MARYAFNHLDSIAEVLRQSPFGLITDVDGTISPTAPTPQQARVSPLCHRYLALLCQQIALVAAISGRPTARVKEMIDIVGMVYIGNHGLERWVDGHPELTEGARNYLAVVRSAIGELSPLLSIEGIIIENNGITATIHYRRCPDPKLAEKYALAAVQNSPQASKLQVMPGRMAINLLPPVTVLAFAITSEEMPETLTEEADFTLKGVSDVERFLEWMSRTAAQLA